MSTIEQRLNSIDILEDDWKYCDEGGSRLYTSIPFRGIGRFHFDAFRVGHLCACGGGHGMMASAEVAERLGCRNYSQEVDTDLGYVREQYNEFCWAAAQDEAWSEIEIRGRRYVVFGCPCS